MATAAEVVASLNHPSSIIISSCCKTGPGYATPLDAMSGPTETLIYVTCVYSGSLLSLLYSKFSLFVFLILNLVVFVYNGPFKQRCKLLIVVFWLVSLFLVSFSFIIHSMESRLQLILNNYLTNYESDLDSKSLVDRDLMHATSSIYFKSLETELFSFFFCMNEYRIVWSQPHLLICESICNLTT